jgi:hypothetical protein
MTQLAMTKTNRASLLRLALCLSRWKSMSLYAFDADVASGALRSRRRRWRRTGAALQP